MNTDARFPLAGLDTTEVEEAYGRLFVDLSDIELLDLCARTICRPRSNPDSFSLHAPLELLARFLLMSVASPSVRRVARIRMLKIATEYAAGGEWLAEGAEPRPAAPSTARDLRAAIAHGDVLSADTHMRSLCRELDDPALRRCIGLLFDSSLAGAGHGPILLNLIGRSCAGGARQVQHLFRNFARALASNPEQRVQWSSMLRHTGEQVDVSDLTAVTEAAVRETRLLDQGVEGGIYELVHSAEESGELSQRLGYFQGLDWTNPVVRNRVGNALCRMAALGMLAESEKHAKFGWTHCLTLPQAAWMASSYSDNPAPAMALAGSFVVSFRRGLARERWNGPSAVQAVPFDRRAFFQAVQDGPEAAVSAASSVSDADQRLAFRLLATCASVRTDTHLVKYTLACYDASHSDREHGDVYLAAAAKLNAIWMRDEPLADDPGGRADVS